MIQCLSYNQARLELIRLLADNDCCVKSATITYDGKYYWIGYEDFDSDEYDEIFSEDEYDEFSDEDDAFDEDEDE